tara:strand:- start:1677 stop:1925 length:249 start_codon:yes stop_codon:yes gene_type:complete
MLKNIAIITKTCDATFDEASLRSVYDLVKRMGLDRCVELEESNDGQKYTMEMMEAFRGPRAEIRNRSHGSLIEVIHVQSNLS